jgi:hypothetical protein
MMDDDDLACHIVQTVMMLSLSLFTGKQNTIPSPSPFLSQEAGAMSLLVT